MRIISSYRRADRLWGSCKPSVQWVAVYVVVRRPGRKADCSYLLLNVRINVAVPPFIHVVS